MFKMIIIVILLICSVSVYAEDNPMHELLTTESIYKCRDYEMNASSLIPKYYEDQKYDSLEIILNYWEEECGLSYRIVRLRLLLSLNNGTFSEDLYESFKGDFDIIKFMVNYRQRSEYLYENGYHSSDFNETDKVFDEFFHDLAETTLTKYQEESIENFWLLFFSREFDKSFEKLKSDTYKNTILRGRYNSYINSVKKKGPGQRHFSVNIGQWNPTSQLKTVGNHSDYGIGMGRKYNNTILDLSISVRFLNAKNMYQIRNTNGVMETTDKFRNAYVGIDLSHRITAVKTSHLYFLWGIGLEEITSVDDAVDKGSKKLGLQSFNVNLGLENKIYINKFRTRYISLYSKYNIVNFNNNDGTDLSGHVITIGIKFGFLQFGFAREDLKTLNDFK